MLDILSVVFWGIIMLSIIVFVHESGHFLMCRLLRIRVREFMIGLPGPSLSFTRDRTRYGVTAVPLGGYCLIAGESGVENPHLAEAYSYLAYWGTLTTGLAERSSEALGFDLVEALDALESWMTISARKNGHGGKIYEMLPATVDGVDYAQGQARPVASKAAAQEHIDAERRYTYTGAAWWRRVMVLLGGSVFNLLFAIIVITTVLMLLGVSEPTTMVGTVVEGTPAYEAGLLPGDTLLGFNDTSYETTLEFTEAISQFASGDSIELHYLRDGVEYTVPITLVNSDGRVVMGITWQYESQPMSIIDALGLTFGIIGMVINAILQLFNPATFSTAVSSSSSIVGVAVESSRAASFGLFSFLVLAAQLSISIGLMNMLPVPPLDGGKIIVETIQRITRRVISPRIIGAISLTALVLLIVLFIVVTGQDIQRYFLGG